MRHVNHTSHNLHWQCCTILFLKTTLSRYLIERVRYFMLSEEFVFGTAQRIVSANTVGCRLRQGVCHDSKLYDILWYTFLFPFIMMQYKTKKCWHNIDDCGHVIHVSRVILADVCKCPRTILYCIILFGIIMTTQK